MKEYTNSEINDFLYNNIDALVVVSAIEDKYVLVKSSELIAKHISTTGSYNELVKKFLFHLNKGSSDITEEYQIFLPKMGHFNGKTSQKGYLEINGVNHAVQMLVYPIDQKNGEYIIILCVLDAAEIQRDIIADNKVKTIQETYLFSMYVDLNKDNASGINISEISNDNMHYEVKYSEWRNMIVNMFLPEDQVTFLEYTDPDYLRNKLKQGNTFSYDCKMKNLEGEFIWVKLIFGRSETTSEQDFRFVFMVQNINDDSLKLFDELKKMEYLASHDTLTGVYNHGRIETEIGNAHAKSITDDNIISLMMLDIDYFKSINDTYGHAVGDDILKAFVGCVNEIIKDYDIKMGRWGGEEFVCVCYDSDVTVLMTIADKIKEKLLTTNFDSIDKLTCSIGITNMCKTDTVKSAFVRLDEALYEAKKGGRNCCRVIQKL